MIKNLLRSKDAKFNTALVTVAVIGIVFLVILLTVYSVLIPEAQTAGDSLNISVRCADAGCFYNTSNDNSTVGVSCIESSALTNNTCATQLDAIPLATLFSGTGVVFVIIMATLIILIVRAYLKKIK